MTQSVRKSQNIHLEQELKEIQDIVLKSDMNASRNKNIGNTQPSSVFMKKKIKYAQTDYLDSLLNINNTLKPETKVSRNKILNELKSNNCKSFKSFIAIKSSPKPEEMLQPKKRGRKKRLRVFFPKSQEDFLKSMRKSDSKRYIDFTGARDLVPSAVQEPAQNGTRRLTKVMRLSKF